MNLHSNKWNFKELNKNQTKTSYKMQITKCKDTNPPIKFYVHIGRLKAFVLFLPFYFLIQGSHVPMAFTPEALELAQS